MSRRYQYRHHLHQHLDFAMSTVATDSVSDRLGSLRDLVRRIFTSGNQDASPRIFDRAQHMVIQYANFMINQNADIVLGPPHPATIHPAAPGQRGSEPTAAPSPPHVYDLPRSLNNGSDIYVDCLLPKGYGHPLWVPSPNMSLPIPYRALGVSVGDVGVLTPKGGFDFLFNIFHDPTHPINAAVGVLDTFVPFTPAPAAVDIQHFVELNAGSFLADPSIITVRNDGDRSATTFEATGPEGAVLVIPEDMHSTTLKITTRLRKYVAENIVAWYRYVKHSLGHDIDNGDLLVVYGCQKSIGFGIATAFNTGRRENTQLSFFVEGSQADTSRCPYRWTHTGSAEAKAGSSVQSNVEFSSAEPARNQCLFIKTIKTRLSAEKWTSADLDTVMYGVPSPNLRESEYTKHGSTGQSSAFGSESTSFSSLAPSHEPAFHLSAVLYYILEAITPGPSTYIVCDDDWAPFISDGTLDAREFIDRILANRTIIEDQGTMFFGASNDTGLLEKLNQGHGAHIRFNRNENSSNTNCSHWKAERRISSGLTQRTPSPIKEGVHGDSDHPSFIMGRRKEKSSSISPAIALRGAASLAKEIVTMVQSAKEVNNQSGSVTINAMYVVGHLQGLYNQSREKDYWLSPDFCELITELVVTLVEMTTFIKEGRERDPIELFPDDEDIAEMQIYSERIQSVWKNFQLGQEDQNQIHLAPYLDDASIETFPPYTSHMQAPWKWPTDIDTDMSEGTSVQFVSALKSSDASDQRFAQHTDNSAPSTQILPVADTLPSSKVLDLPTHPLEVKNDTMFSNATVVNIIGGTFNSMFSDATLVEGSYRVPSLDAIRLYRHVTPSAIFNSPERADTARCHAGTREQAIGRIEKWRTDVESNSEARRMFWLSGPAGAGKTAIMQTVAERWAAQGMHLATFFFSREKDLARSLVPTLLYQILTLHAGALDKIEQILASRPHILEASIEDQFDHLMGSTVHSFHLHFPEPIVLLIDGLDECIPEEKESQRQILQALDTLVSDGSRFLVLVSGRSNLQIVHALKEVRSEIDSIFLDDKYSPEEDIRLFVTANYDKVKSTESVAVNPDKVI